MYRHYYEDIFKNTRSPERVEELMLLVDILYAADISTLNNVINIADMTQITEVNRCDRTEAMVAREAENLLTKMGIEITVESVIKYPLAVSNLLTFLIDHIENYEDTTTILSVLESEISSHEKLYTLTDLTTDRINHELLDIIVNVDDYIVATMKAMVTTRERHAEVLTPHDPRIVSNLIAYLDKAWSEEIEELIGCGRYRDDINNQRATT